jgi:hypothetical protein
MQNAKSSIYYSCVEAARIRAAGEYQMPAPARAVPSHPQAQTLHIALFTSDAYLHPQEILHPATPTE